MKKSRIKNRSYRVRGDSFLLSPPKGWRTHPSARGKELQPGGSCGLPGSLTASPCSWQRGRATGREGARWEHLSGGARAFAAARKELFPLRASEMT